MGGEEEGRGGEGRGTQREMEMEVEWEGEREGEREGEGRIKECHVLWFCSPDQLHLAIGAVESKGVGVVRSGLPGKTLRTCCEGIGEQLHYTEESQGSRPHAHYTH